MLRLCCLHFEKAKHYSIGFAIDLQHSYSDKTTPNDYASVYYCQSVYFNEIKWEKPFKTIALDKVKQYSAF